MATSRNPQNDEAAGEEPIVVGWRERVALPDLGIARLRAKVDTGAKTSAILAREVEMFERDGVSWVRFTVYPFQRTTRGAMRCESQVIDVRHVRSSTGHSHDRPVIRTRVTLGGRTWPIEVTLAKRKHLKFRMLLGREALAGRCLVDSGGSYLMGRKPTKRPPAGGTA